jgi:ubiquitin C-terminal hydrolase
MPLNEAFQRACRAICTSTACFPYVVVKVDAVWPVRTLAHVHVQGTLLDYVKCHECGTVREKRDAFMDLSLVIRPFGAPPNKSVEEALDYFVKPEMMSGSDKVECEVCGTKTDSVKGLRLASLPDILLLQLKRFDFDYNTLQRVKLNDYVRVNFLVSSLIHPLSERLFRNSLSGVLPVVAEYEPVRGYERDCVCIATRSFSW